MSLDCAEEKMKALVDQAIKNEALSVENTEDKFSISSSSIKSTSTDRVEALENRYCNLVHANKMHLL